MDREREGWRSGCMGRGRVGRRGVTERRREGGIEDGNKGEREER